MHVLLFKSGLEILEPQFFGFIQKFAHAAADFHKLLGGRHLIGPRRQHIAARLTLQVHHAHHVELVKIIEEDRQELDAIQERHLAVFGRLKHLAIEFDPADFAIGVQRRGIQVDRGRRLLFLDCLGRLFRGACRLLGRRLAAALDGGGLCRCRLYLLFLVRSRNFRLLRLLLNLFCVAFSHFFSPSWLV